MVNNPYLFVYGTLRSSFASEAYEYMSRYFNWVAHAKVKGVLYNLGEYPAAVPAIDNKFITGELFKLKYENEFNDAFLKLDDYEGLLVEQGEIPLYRREMVNVYLNNEIINAWIYWYNNKITDEPIIESGDILGYLNSKNE